MVEDLNKNFRRPVCEQRHDVDEFLGFLSVVVGIELSYYGVVVLPTKNTEVNLSSENV